MSYETRVRTAKGFHAALEHLEVDSGVRTRATFKGRRSLVFITRHSGRYSIWLRPTEAKDDPGTFRDFTRLADLERFLSPILSYPVSASVY